MSVRYAKRGTCPDEIDVSRYGSSPWRQLSPYVKAPEPLPIPGHVSYLDLEEYPSFPGWWATTTEGIWQGLKVIATETAPGQFQGPPKKRRGRPEGHRYGDYRQLGYLEAKALIYIPAYLSQLRQCPKLLKDVREKAEEGCGF